MLEENIADIVSYLNRNRSIFRRIHCLHHVRIRRFHVLVQGIFANTDKGIKYSSHCWFKNDLLVVYKVSKENFLDESLLEFFSMDFDRCWLFLFWFLRSAHYWEAWQSQKCPKCRSQPGLVEEIRWCYENLKWLYSSNFQNTDCVICFANIE